MSRKEVETFAAAILSADGFDARRAAIALVVAAQALIANDPMECQILADTMRAVASELDGKKNAQSGMMN